MTSKKNESKDSKDEYGYKEPKSSTKTAIVLANILIAITILLALLKLLG